MVNNHCDSDDSDQSMSSKRIKIEENSYPDTTNCTLSEQSCSNANIEHLIKVKF